MKRCLSRLSCYSLSEVPLASLIDSPPPPLPLPPQGTTVDKAPTTLMAYMLSDFYREGVSLDFPKGGTDSIVEALVCGLTKARDFMLSLFSYLMTAPMSPPMSPPMTAPITPTRQPSQ